MTGRAPVEPPPRDVETLRERLEIRLLGVSLSEIASAMSPNLAGSARARNSKSHADTLAAVHEIELDTHGFMHIEGIHRRNEDAPLLEVRVVLAEEFLVRRELDW